MMLESIPEPLIQIILTYGVVTGFLAGTIAACSVYMVLERKILEAVLAAIVVFLLALNFVVPAAVLAGFEAVSMAVMAGVSVTVLVFEPETGQEDSPFKKISENKE